MPYPSSTGLSVNRVCIGLCCKEMLHQLYWDNSPRVPWVGDYIIVMSEQQACICPIQKCAHVHVRLLIATVNNHIPHSTCVTTAPIFLQGDHEDRGGTTRIERTHYKKSVLMYHAWVMYNPPWFMYNPPWVTRIHEHAVSHVLSCG